MKLRVPLAFWLGGIISQLAWSATPVSYQSFIEKYLAKNLDLKAKHDEIVQSKNISASYQHLPTAELDIGGSYGRTDSEEIVKKAEIAGRQDIRNGIGITLGTKYLNQLDGRVPDQKDTYIQFDFDLGRNVLGELDNAYSAIASKNISASELEYQKALRDLCLEGSREYYRAYFLQEKVQIGKKILTLLNSEKLRIEKLYRDGFLTKIDWLRFKLEFRDQTRNLKLLDAEYHAQLSFLASWLPEDNSLALEKPPLPSKGPIDVSDSIDLVLQKIALERQALESDRLSRENRASIKTYAAMGQGNTYVAGDDVQGYGLIGVAMEIGSSNLQKAELENSMVGERIEKSKLDELSRRLERNYRMLSSQIAYLEDTLQELQEVLNLSTATIGESKRNFEAMKRQFSDYVEDLSQYSQIKMNYVQSQLDLFLKSAELIGFASSINEKCEIGQ